MVFGSIDEIERQLLAGEDSLAEFKRVALTATGVRSPNAEDFAGELCAFSNASGGALFLGIDDDGTVTGIPGDALRRVEEWVINIARNNCDPPIVPAVRSVVLPDSTGAAQHVLVVEAQESLYVHRTSGGRWYLRVGSSKRDLSPTELPRLLRDRSRSYAFDEALVPTAMVEDLNESALRRQLGAPEGIDWRQLLLNRRVIAADDRNMLRPTVAGMLAFGDRPVGHLRGASISAAVYRGAQRDSDDLVHAQDINGTIDRQIDEAVALVERFMLRPARKSQGRQDYPQFDLDGIHEAIVNAVVHRDYSIGGSRVRLFLYQDRLELSSPGGLPNTLTVETMRYRQFTRNQLLVSFVSRIRSQRTGRAFIEERGEGVELIFRRSTALAGREPEYALHGDELMLTIWGQVSPHDAR